MFTGIIENTGIIKGISAVGTNKSFHIESSLSHELTIDQSLSHNGVCLTIEAIENDIYQVTAIRETLEKTNLSDWKINDLVNLERCMTLNGRLDGHIVQGHVDCTATCIERKDLGGSWEFEFKFPKKFDHLMIEKGSVCINGISLTAFDVMKKSFRVAIIPYTFDNTNIKSVLPGTRVNLEFDMIGKYISKMYGAYKSLK